MFNVALILGELVAIVLGFGLAYLVSRVVHLKATTITLATLLVMTVLSNWIMMNGFMGLFEVKIPLNHMLMAFFAGLGLIVILQRKTKAATAA